MSDSRYLALSSDISHQNVESNIVPTVLAHFLLAYMYVERSTYTATFNVGGVRVSTYM